MVMVIVLCGQSNVALGMFVMGISIICVHCLIKSEGHRLKGTTIQVYMTCALNAVL